MTKHKIKTDYPVKSIEFERQDLRRLWLTLGAIETMDHPSLSVLSKALGMQMSTLQKVIVRLNSDQLPGLTISISKGAYSVTSWGIINKEKIVEYYELFVK